jgi:uncharacterized MAPEG superfamily protein
MSEEFYWLTATVVLTGLIWVPYILDRVAIWGLMPTLANPPVPRPRQSEWAERMRMAHTNAVENLVVFAPLVLMLGASDISSPTTVLTCQVFFGARLAHLVFFTIGIAVLRTLAFVVGFGAQVVLVLALFGAV